MNGNGAVRSSRMLGRFLGWCALAAIIATIMAISSLALQAQTTYTVTRFDDANAGTLEAGGGFGPGNSGDLRYGLFQAMAAGGANAINFACAAPPCTITLSAPLPPIFETANISSFNLTIDGGTEGSVVHDGNSAGGQYNRVFFVDNVAVTLRNLVIQHAAVLGGAGFGACLFVNQSTAAVIVQNTTFNGCTAAGGQGGSYAAVGGTGGGGGLDYPGGNGSGAYAGALHYTKRRIADWLWVWTPNPRISFRRRPACEDCPDLPVGVSIVSNIAQLSNPRWRILLAAKATK